MCFSASPELLSSIEVNRSRVFFLGGGGEGDALKRKSVCTQVCFFTERRWNIALVRNSTGRSIH